MAAKSSAYGPNRRRRFPRPVQTHHEKDRAVWRKQPVCFLVGRRRVPLNMDGQRAVGILLQARQHRRNQNAFTGCRGLDVRIHGFNGVVVAPEPGVGSCGTLQPISIKVSTITEVVTYLPAFNVRGSAGNVIVNFRVLFLNRDELHHSFW